MNKHCIYPSNFNIQTINNKNQESELYNKLKTMNEPICWLIEKDVTKSRRAYLIAPIYANLLPKTKVLMIVREPIAQMISFVTKTSNLNSKHIVHSKYKSDVAAWMYKYYIQDIVYSKIRQGCKDLFENLTQLNTSQLKKELTVNFLNSKMIKNFFKLYLYYGAALDSLDIMEGNRQDKSFSTTVHIAPFLLFIYSYDEVFGYNNYSNFRLIQHEWLYSNLFQGLVTIKCWLQTNKEIKLDVDNMDNYNTMYMYMYDECHEIFFDSKEYYNEMKKYFVDKKTMDYKINSKTPIGYRINEEYEQKLIQFYKPMVQLLIFVVKQRHELLLGQWNEWNKY